MKITLLYAKKETTQDDSKNMREAETHSSTGSSFSTEVVIFPYKVVVLPYEVAIFPYVLGGPERERERGII